MRALPALIAYIKAICNSYNIYIYARTCKIAMYMQACKAAMYMHACMAAMFMQACKVAMFMQACTHIIALNAKGNDGTQSDYYHAN